MVPLAALLLGGCFSYVALDGATPARGADIIARLAEPLEVPLQDITVRQVTTVVGKVAYADQDSLVVVAERFTSDAGANYPGLGTGATIRRSQILDLRQRHVAAGRTALLMGGGAAALLAIVRSVGPLFGSGSGAPPGPPAQP
jgi:hypothetical protein